MFRSLFSAQDYEEGFSFRFAFDLCSALYMINKASLTFFFLFFALSIGNSIINERIEEWEDPVWIVSDGGGGGNEFGECICARIARYFIGNKNTTKLYERGLIKKKEKETPLRENFFNYYYV